MSATPSCESIEILLPAYLSGELPAAQLAVVRAHLDGCASCREMADTLQLLHSAMVVEPLPDTLDEPRRALIQETFRRRAARPSLGQRWAAFLELLNPARSPTPALRFAVAIIVFVALPIVMMALLLPAKMSAKRRSMESASRMPASQAVPADVQADSYDFSVEGNMDGVGWKGEEMAGTVSGELTGDRKRNGDYFKEEESFRQRTASASKPAPAKAVLPAVMPAAPPVPVTTAGPARKSELGRGEALGARLQSGKELEPQGELLGSLAADAPRDDQSGGRGGQGLTKDGIGTLTLNGNNTYAGGTVINGGAFVSDGAVTGYRGAFDEGNLKADLEADKKRTVGGKDAPLGDAIGGEGKLGATTHFESTIAPVETRHAASPQESAATDSFADQSDLTAERDVAEAKAPLVMKGLFAGRAAGGRASQVSAPEDEKLAAKTKTATEKLAPAAGAPAPKALKVAVAGDVSVGQNQVQKRDTVRNLREDLPVSGLNKESEAKPEPTRPVPPRQPAGFNPFLDATADAFSTFSIDVDTASYTLTRRALSEGRLPDPEEVRTEEIVNAFDYDYTPPAAGAFAMDAQLAPSPFRAPLELLKIGVKGRALGRDAKKAAVLTLVIDSSGSMDTPDRLGRIRRALHLLVDQLKPSDSVAIVAFNDTARLVLDRTPAANKEAILAAIEHLACSGSTQLEGGLQLAYEVAAHGFVSGGANRVILMSDGVANLGAATATEILQRIGRYRKQGLYLTVLGFGSGNYDDAMLMQLANKGDGMYAYVDSDEEAKRLLVDQWEQTLHVIAKDVKIQVEFNPERVRRWRQIGYEKRHLNKEDFRNDKVDAGEVGSGQAVTALYDVELAGDAALPIATVRVRYQDPDTGRVTELEQRVGAAQRTADFQQASLRYRVAACAAEFAELLRASPYTAGSDFGTVADTLRPAALELPLDQRVQELLHLVEAAHELTK